MAVPDPRPGAAPGGRGGRDRRRAAARRTSLSSLLAPPRAPLAADRLDPGAVGGGSRPERVDGPPHRCRSVARRLVRLGRGVVGARRLRITRRRPPAGRCRPAGADRGRRRDGRDRRRLKPTSTAGATPGTRTVTATVRYEASGAFPLSSGSWAVLLDDGTEVVLEPVSQDEVLHSTLGAGQRLDVPLTGTIRSDATSAFVVYVDGATSNLVFAVQVP